MAAADSAPLTPQRLRRRILALAVYGVALFLLLTLFRFPLGTLVGCLSAKYADRLAVALMVEDLGFSGLGNLRAKGLTLADKANPQRVYLTIDRADFDLSLLALIRREWAMSIRADLLGGTLEGSGSLGPETGHLDLTAAGLQIAGLPALSIGLAALEAGGTTLRNVAGRIGGTIRGEFPAANPWAMKGRMQLTADGLSAEHGFALFTGSDKLVLESLALQVESNGESAGAVNEMEFHDSAAKGPDGELKLTGKLRLARDLPRSMADMQVRLTLMGGPLAGNLRPILDSKRGRISKISDTEYLLTVRGPLNSAFRF